MRASESHRVHFHGARVHALLGGPDELLRDPWFGRDAIRTAATWAGIADAARAAALEALAPRALDDDDLAALAVGRIDTHAQTIDLWLAEAGRRADAHPEAAMRTLSVHLREAIARAAQALVDEALRAAGSRPLARGGALDRAARDLRIFLLQHRLDPLLVRGRTRGGRPVTLAARELRSAATPRPRPVGLRDQRLRARQVRAHAGGARRPSLRPRLRGGLLDRRLHRDARRALRPPAGGRLRAAGGRRRARAPGRLRPGSRRAPLAARGVAGRPVRPDRLLGGPLLLGPRTLDAALAHHRRLAGARRAPGRRPLPPAVDASTH